MDVTFFVTAVQIQRQAGGDLAEVLDNIGEIIRDRIKLYGQVRALSAEGRLSGWILMALPPGMLVVEMFLNPAYAGRLLHTEIGHMLLWGAAISQLFGLLMIRKIVNIKV
jgi:tight adherence protein B